jgi:iron complex outermembrane receptor protein
MFVDKPILKKLTLAISLTLPFGVYADEQTTDNKSDTTELSPMVVSATLSEVQLDKAPGTVHYVDDKKIEMRDVRRVGDVLREMPGVYMAIGATSALPASGNRAVRQSVRGISGGARTLVMMDDQKMNDPTFGTLNWGTIFPEDIDHVEVVPGSGSALYGGNAFAGTMRIFTKKPTKREVLIKGSYLFDAAEGTSDSAIYRDVFDNGLSISMGHHHELNDGIKDILGYATAARVGVATPGVTGAIPDVTARGVPTMLVGDHGRAPWESHVSHLKAFYDFNDYTRVSAGLHYAFSEVGYNQSTSNSFLRGANGSPFTNGNFSQNGSLWNVTPSTFLNSPSHEDDLRSFVKLEHNFSKDTVLTLNFNHTLRDYWFTNVGPTSTFTGGPGTSTQAPSTMINGKAQLVFPLMKDHIMTAGFEIDQGEMNRKDYNVSNWVDWTTRSKLNLKADAVTTTTSIFGQDEMHLTDKLTAYLGTRIDFWDVSGTSNDYANNKFNPNREQSTVEVNPKLALVYDAPWEGATLRASAGKSFRPPTLSDLYIDSRRGTVLSYANQSLTPESNLSWEVGIEQRIVDTGSHVKATFFENNLTDMITSQTLPLEPGYLSVTKRINTASAITRGVELSFDQKITDWLTYYNNYTWTPTAQTIENKFIPIQNGKRLPNAPEHLFTAGLEANWEKWSGTFIGRYVSESFDTAENLDYVHDVYGGFQSFWLFDTKLRYSPIKSTSVSFAVNNLLNQEYFQFAPNPGRNFIAEVSFKF